MSLILLVEQALNGLQFGLMLFLLASGLTLVFGIMDMINLAHGALYMVGAFFAAWLAPIVNSFWLAIVLAVPLTALVGMFLEATLLRTLYQRDHLAQVLATFALILILNEAVRMIWGSDMSLPTPQALSGPVELLPGLYYPSYRLMIIGVGLMIALLLWFLQISQWLPDLHTVRAFLEEVVAWGAVAQEDKHEPGGFAGGRE